jgi:hypothetical protein
MLSVFVTDVEVRGVWGLVFSVLWPTFRLIRAADNGGGIVFTFILSAAANVVVYGLLGIVISLVYRRFCVHS